MVFFKVPEDLEKYANWQAIKNREYRRAFKREFYEKVKYGDLCIDEINYCLTPTKELLFEVFKRLLKERKEIKPHEPFNLRVIRNLRAFVEFVSECSKDKIKLHIEEKLKEEFEKIKTERGVSLTYEQISKEFIYTIMNRILFYKVLEKYWEGIEKLKPLYDEVKINNGKVYFETLKKYFRKAVEVTGDFEPVFVLKFYDELILPDNSVILQIIDSLIYWLDNIEIERLGDVIGYVYEEIIPEKE
jgi:hypothetical protein